MFYKKENQVAYIPETDTGHIITTELSGIGEEKKYTIERVEPFDPKEWDVADLDEWLTAWSGITGLTDNSYYSGE